MAIAHQPMLGPQNSDEEERYPSSDGKPMAETEEHRNLMVYAIGSLKAFFADRPDVYVSGNNFVYYREGEPKARVSPDCYVIFGAGKHLRTSYRLWRENGLLPAVVFEFTSKKTRREDTTLKLPLYEQTLRVPEYFQFDPMGDYLKPRLQGVRLIDGRYAPLELVDNRLHSQQLGLDFVWQGEMLRFFDPIRGEFLLTFQEQTDRAEAETARADEAEAEVARLRAKLNALRERHGEL